MRRSAEGFEGVYEIRERDEFRAYLAMASYGILRAYLSEDGSNLGSGTPARCAIPTSGTRLEKPGFRCS